MLSEFEPTTPFGPVVAGQIADLTHLQEHRVPELVVGVHAAPAAASTPWTSPTRLRRRQTGFIPALPGNYHGEGAHVISAHTKAFKGDLLAVNNEFCTDTPSAGGGFDLYDVSNPAHPEILVQGAGDRGGEGEMTGSEDPRRQHLPLGVPVGGRQEGLPGGRRQHRVPRRRHLRRHRSARTRSRSPSTTCSSCSPRSRTSRRTAIKSSTTTWW